jgi:hypothetical protein
VLGRGSATDQMVADFLDLPVPKAKEALNLAEDLGLVRDAGGVVEPASPIARLLTTPVLQQRAALLRVAVESYEPFLIFRERLHANDGAASSAAQQTKSLLRLTEHREIIKETLISLGTYCRSFRSTGGGEHTVQFEYEDDLRTQLAGAVSQLSAADQRVRDWLSEELRGYAAPRDVLDPLAEAYLKVSQGDSRGSILNAGNAVESYLTQLASDMAVNVTRAHGLGAKVVAFESASALPKKIIAIGRYLSNIRNGADHGVDSDIGASWSIRDGTGEDFLRVSITLMEIALAHHQGKPPAL